MMICDSWQWIPFIFICMLAALENVPRDHVEAAQVDGASSVQIFREITWPQILPVAVTVLLIRMIEAFKIVDLPNIMTGGGPGIVDGVDDASLRLCVARERHRHLGRDRLSPAHPDGRRLRFVLQLRGPRAIAEGAGMSNTSFKFEKSNRSLFERLFEPPDSRPDVACRQCCGAISCWCFWSIFVIFPIYWVVITSFKDAAAVNQGPFYIPFLDFQPNLDAWRAQFNSDPNCDIPSILRQVGLLFYNAFVFIVSPVVTLQPMEPQICKIYLAFTNSIVISFAATAICVAIGSMAAYALARVQYKPKFGNIMMFVLLTLAGDPRHQLSPAFPGGCPLPWPRHVLLPGRAPSASISRRTLGNGDILFWIISQRILPPIVVIIPIYMMFQAVGLLDTHLALILVYAVANLPIVVWLMHDFFANLPIELEESAQLDGASRFADLLGHRAAADAARACGHHAADADPELERVSFRRVPRHLQGADHAHHGGGQECRREGRLLVGDVRHHRGHDHSGHLMAILLQRFIAKGVLLGAVKG